MTKQLTDEESIRRLHDEFGAEVAFTYAPRVLQDPAIRRQRHVNASMIRNFSDQQVETYEFKQVPGGVAVVWDYAHPERSSARATLRRTLGQAGVPDDMVSHLWVVPYELGRVPLSRDIATYRQWVIDGLYASQVKYVLLVGSRPLWMFRPDMKLSVSEGHVFLWKEQWVVFPISNPLTLNKYESQTWRNHLLKFGTMVREGGDINHLDTQCLHDGLSLYMYDPDGVALCKEHTVEGFRAHNKAVTKWRTLEIEAGQPSMFPDGG